MARLHMTTRIRFLGFIVLTFLFCTMVQGQEVWIKKNTSNDPRIEIKSPSKNSFIGDSTGISNVGILNTSVGNKSLYSNTSGNRNVAIGSNALKLNTTGSQNVVIGDSAALASNGSYNTIIGSKAGTNNTAGYVTIIGVEAGRYNQGYGNVLIGSAAGTANTTGSVNTFIGDNAGRLNTTGYNNTLFGSFAGYSNITGHNNTFIGAYAGYTCIGNENTALGDHALYSNTSGIFNIAIGNSTMYFNTTGNYNTAVGWNALKTNTNGTNNSAFGFQSLVSNTSGVYNTGYGQSTLFNNTTGGSNCGVGGNALLNNTSGGSNSGFGLDAMYQNTTGSYNTGLGRNAGCNASQNPSNLTAVGYNSGHVGGTSNTIEIGNTSVTWIGGQVNWSTYSDQRIKENIQSNVPGLQFINKLNPVTYNLNIHRENEICGITDTAQWDGKYAIEKITQSGFIAQEVEAAAQAVQYDFNGVLAPNDSSKLYSLQYASFVVPLVKAVQELSEENSALKTEVSKLQTTLETMNERLALLEGKTSNPR